MSYRNLEAWAVTRGYDPERDYTGDRPGVFTPHFTPDEFRCHHCGELPEDGMARELLLLLEVVRYHFGAQPVTINSGYRCPHHNAEVGGASNSQHLYGTAADIVVEGTKPSEVYAWLDPWHDGGLGSYETFTHVDVRGSRARWSG